MIEVIKTVLAVIGGLTVASAVVLILALISAVVLILALIFDTCDQDDFDD